MLRIYPVPAAAINPYIDLSNRELSALGASVVTRRFSLETPHVHEHIERASIVHFHWPHMLYSSPTREGFERRLGLWETFLANVSARGYIVWTAHNVFPHENPFPDLGIRARQLLISHCDHIIVHCRAARARLQAEFGALPPVSILTHPNLASAYPAPPDRRLARHDLNLPDGAFLFLMFGLMRDYKGIGAAIAAFREFRSSRMRLYIAGKSHRRFDVKAVARLAEGDPRIAILDQLLPAEMVSALFAVADVALHCYTDMLTSGTISLAQGMDTAVIAPRIGCLEEMVPESCGILYDPRAPHGLKHAMQQATEMDVQAMGRAGQRFVVPHTVQNFAKELMQVYRSLSRHIGEQRGLTS